MRSLRCPNRRVDREVGGHFRSSSSCRWHGCDAYGPRGARRNVGGYSEPESSFLCGGDGSDIAGRDRSPVSWSGRDPYPFRLRWRKIRPGPSGHLGVSSSPVVVRPSKVRRPVLCWGITEVTAKRRRGRIPPQIERVERSKFWRGLGWKVGNTPTSVPPLHKSQAIATCSGVLVGRGPRLGFLPNPKPSPTLPL